MIHVNGDLLTAPFQFIAHQVNCRGVMGAGIALQIKNKYPEVYDAYKVFCNINTAKPSLGKSLCVWTKDNHCVINVFGQLGYSTDYDALYSGFSMAAEEIRNTFLDGNPCYQIPIAIPYGIGCGLAGGEAKFVFKETVSDLGVVETEVEYRKAIPIVITESDINRWLLYGSPMY